MIKKIIFCILLLIAVFQLSGQKSPDKIKIKKSRDTIDYFYLNYKPGYHFVSLFGGSGKMAHNCGKALIWRLNIDSTQTYVFNWDYPKKFNKGDTAVSIEWYLKNDNKCFSNMCERGNLLRYGKCYINKRTNILIFEKFQCQSDIESGKYMFKVIKFSEYEIILKDLQRRSDVFYHFIKN